MRFFVSPTRYISERLKKGVIRMENKQFSEKLSKYKDTVFRVAYSYCKNKSDSEDVSQDVFLKFYTTSPNIETESEEKAWLIRVTINKCKDLLKSSWHSKRCEREELKECSPMNDAQSELLDIVLSLPDKYKIVIHLYYYEQYTINEISEITGRKPSTVQTQLQRGRSLLEKKLKEEKTYEQNIIQLSYEQNNNE